MTCLKRPFGHRDKASQGLKPPKPLEPPPGEMNEGRSTLAVPGCRRWLGFCQQRKWRPGGCVRTAASAHIRRRARRLTNENQARSKDSGTPGEDNNTRLLAAATSPTGNAAQLRTFSYSCSQHCAEDSCRTRTRSSSPASLHPSDDRIPARPLICPRWARRSWLQKGIRARDRQSDGGRQGPCRISKQLCKP